MLTMTHSTSLRVSPQVFCHRNCVLIIWEMRSAYYSKVLELMGNSRRVRPTCQMRTCSALPMDWTHSGDSLSLDFSHFLSAFSVLPIILPIFLIVYPVITQSASQHGRGGVRGRGHNGADRIVHLSHTGLPEGERST